MAIRQGRGIARLDGNALAGALGDVLHGDVTTMVGTCGGCGASQLLATAIVELDESGCIVLCRECEHTLFTVLREDRRSRVIFGTLHGLTMPEAGR